MIADHILHALLAIIPIVLAITLHEVAHGYAAWALGDRTARDAGRLSLNPLKHVDRVGTILLPGILLIGQLLTLHRVAFMFGWAKPVPVNALAFQSPRRGMAVVALAGPMMNFFLVWLVAVIARFVPDAWISLSAATMITDFMLTNMVLGLFNLIPLPPLDGGRIAVGLLPLRMARQWAGIERYGLAIVITSMLVLPNLFGFNPINSFLEIFLPRALRIIFWLAGYSD